MGLAADFLLMGPARFPCEGVVVYHGRPGSALSRLAGLPLCGCGGWGCVTSAHALRCLGWLGCHNVSVRGGHVLQVPPLRAVSAGWGAQNFRSWMSCHCFAAHV